MNLFKTKHNIHKVLVFLGVIIFPVLVFSSGQFPSTLSDGVQVDVSVTCPNNICSSSVGGCTDPLANNYNSSATFDDGSCSYSSSGGGETPVSGCMDPLATNYNANATVSNNSCQYQSNIPNVTNFTAQKNGSGARLTWSLPNFAQFSSVIIVKSAGRIPTGPTDGEVIYTGAGQSVNDNSITAGTTYYYLAVVKSVNGLYSSGALTSYKDDQSTVVEPPPGNPDVPCIVNCEPNNNNPDNPGGGGGGGSDVLIGSGPVSPFENLPVAGSPTVTISSSTAPAILFVFKQAGEKTKPFFENSYLKIKGNKPFTISVDYYKMPEVLKTIGVTLYSIKNPNQSFSFLMKINATKTAYEATVGAMPEDGEYGVSIYLINYQDQTIKKYTGQLAIVGSLGLLGVGAEKFVKQIAGPVAVTGGVTAGIFQLLFASGNVASFSDIYLLLLRQMGALFGLLGLKKKNKPWGTVYDSVTKRPIDPAYVTVLANQEEIATAITDIDGRYGFSLLDGEYSLKANKTHYQFPSSRLYGQTHDEMYDNLYFGAPFHVLAGEVVNKSIPLDPLDFDWNEFVKSKGNYFKLHTTRELFRSRIIKWVYRAGFLMSLFYLIFYPSILNILVPVIYLAITVGGHYWKQKHKVVTIKNQNGEPISFAIVKIYYADLDQEIKKVVADMVGRFYLLVRPGVYYLTIDHKQPDGSYARIYKSPVTDLKKGVWTADIVI